MTFNNCDTPSQFLFSQSFASILPKPLYLFLMFRFIGVQELDVVCFLSPFLIGPCKLAKQHILLLDGVQPRIIMGYNASEEDGGQPNAEHDNLEPSMDVWRGKERPQVIVRQTKEQVAGHIFPECWANWLGEDSGVGIALHNHRLYGSFHYILVYDCHSWSSWPFLDLYQFSAVVLQQGFESLYNRFLTVPCNLDLMGFQVGVHRIGYGCGELCRIRDALPVAASTTAQQFMRLLHILVFDSIKYLIELAEYVIDRVYRFVL